MSECQIIELGEKSGWLTQEELCSVPSREDSRFANMIHRVVYHRDSKTNPIRRRFIEWNPATSEFTVTEKGFAFLKTAQNSLENQPDGTSQTIEDWLVQFAKDGNKKGGHH
jgi:hypothetical protein